MAALAADGSVCSSGSASSWGAVLGLASGAVGKVHEIDHAVDDRGHTVSVAQPEDNLVRFQQRAEAVVVYFVAIGIDPGRLTADRARRDGDGL